MPLDLITSIIQASLNYKDPPELAVTCVDVATYDRDDIFEACFERLGLHFLLGDDPPNSKIAQVTWANWFETEPTKCRRVLTKLGVNRLQVARSIIHSTLSSQDEHAQAVFKLCELHRGALRDGDEATLNEIARFAMSPSWLATCYRTARRFKKVDGKPPEDFFGST